MVSIIPVVIGLFLVVAAITGSEVLLRYARNRGTRLFESMLGPKGFRVAVGLLGVLFCAAPALR